MAHSVQVLQFFENRKRAYQLVFGGPETPNKKFVLDDLAKFCRERESTFNPDARMHAVLEGRREVILRVRDYLELTVEQLADKYVKE